MGNPYFPRWSIRDMRTPVQSTAPAALTNPDVVEQDTTLYPGQPTHPSLTEESDMTDRPLRFPHGFGGTSDAQEPTINPARARWLEEHDVHTEFLDAGIGCCWFAEKGDQGAVIGATEDEAIARLARNNGWELWVEA